MSRVDRYREYLEVGEELNSRMMESSLSDEAIRGSAELLGLRGEDDVLVYDQDEDMAIQMDFALNDYRQDGKTVVERFREQELWESEVEKEILDALAGSYTSLFRVMSVDESENLLVLEGLLNDEAGVELTDIGLSRSAEPGVLLFFRLVRFEEFNKTSGVMFPFPGSREDDLLEVYRDVSDEIGSYPESMVRFVSFYRMYKEFGIGARYE